MLASLLFVMSALILFTVAVPNASGTTDGANIIDGGSGVGAAKSACNIAGYEQTESLLATTQKPRSGE